MKISLGNHPAWLQARINRGYATGKIKKVNSGDAKEPNKTEAKFNAEVLDGKGQYEGVTFRLAGGTRYTPDWVVWDGSVIHAYEVKGSFRFGSESRAVAAFREAVNQFPYVRFHWFVLDKKVWEEKH